MEDFLHFLPMNTVVSHLASLGIIFGGVLPYLPQYCKAICNVIVKLDALITLFFVAYVNDKIR